MSSSHFTTVFGRSSLFALIVITGSVPRSLAQAPGGQGLPMAGLPTTGPAPAASAAGEEGEKPKGWLLSSPLVDVGWPEFKMPKLNWKTDQSVNKGPGPIERMTHATQGAMTRTRTAWNGAIDKMKIGPFRPKDPNAEPGFFAKLWHGQPEPERSDPMVGFIGQDRPLLR